MSLLGRMTREEKNIKHKELMAKKLRPTIYTASPYALKYLNDKDIIIFNRFKYNEKVYEADKNFSPFMFKIYLEDFASFDDFKKKIFSFFDSIYLSKRQYIHKDLHNKIIISDNKKFRLMILEYFIKKFKKDLITCDILGYIPYIDVVNIFRENMPKQDFMKRFKRYLYLLN